MEYGLHKYIFHGPLWHLHKQHHKLDYKQEYLIPFTYSIPICLLCYLMYIVIFGAYSISLLRGNILGYIGFEYINYVSNISNKLTTKIKKIKYVDELIDTQNKHRIVQGKRYINYGITNVYWDKTFGTFNSK